MIVLFSPPNGHLSDTEIVGKVPRSLPQQPRRQFLQEEEEQAYQLKFREPNFLPKQQEEQGITVVLRSTPV
jgi:hypothetical protein